MKNSEFVIKSSCYCFNVWFVFSGKVRKETFITQIGFKSILTSKETFPHQLTKNLCFVVLLLHSEQVQITFFLIL